MIKLRVVVVGRHEVKFLKSVIDSENGLKLKVVFFHANYSPKLSFILALLLLDIFNLCPSIFF